MKKCVYLSVVGLSSILILSGCELFIDNIEGGIGDITGDTTWEEGTYVLDRSITISGGTLTVEACGVIRMPANGTITVRDNGALKLLGEADCPVTITSDRPAPGRGDWSYIDFQHTSDRNNNIIRHAVIEYGGGGGYGAIYLDNDSSIEFQDSIVRESGHHAIQAQDGAGLRNFTGNTFVENAEEPLFIHPDTVNDLQAGTYSPNSKEGILVAGGTGTKTSTWRDLGVPYVLPNGIWFGADSGSTQITLEAGVVLQMGPSTVLNVGNGAGLRAEGTAADPVVITSSKSSPAAGDWSYLEFSGGSVSGGNELVHTHILYSGGSEYGAIWVSNGTSIAMTDSVIRHSGDVGIMFDGESAPRSFTGNVIESSASYAVDISAISAHTLGVGTYGPNEVQGIRVRHDDVDKVVTWIDHGVPYVIPGGFSVGGDGDVGQLTLGAGVALHIGRDTNVRVTGKLMINGTAADPVSILSAMATPSAGDWGQIEIYSAGNVFTHTSIRHGGGQGYGQLWLGGGASVALNDVIFSDGEDCDVDVGDGQVTGTGSTYTVCN